MRSIKPLIAGNGVAIFLTIACLLPITAIFAVTATAPLDGLMAGFGLWLGKIFGWASSEFDTAARFAKMGFALRIVVIAVGISFLYFARSLFCLPNLLDVPAAKTIADITAYRFLSLIEKL